MEDVENGGPRYFRSWDNIPRDCWQERRSGTDRSIPGRCWAHPQPGLAAGWVAAFWPTMDVEPYQFPKKHKETTQITSSSRNTNHTNHIHPTHQAIAILHWWDDTAHHCCSVNLLGLGMTHIACLPPDPTVHVAWLQRYGRRGILEITNHGYDTACSVNQKTVGSWIGFNSMTSRLADIHFHISTNANTRYVVQVWRSLYASTIFSKISIEESELSWLVSEALVCANFSKLIGWIGSKVTAMTIFSNLLTSFWYSMSSFIFHLASPW